MSLNTQQNNKKVASLYIVLVLIMGFGIPRTMSKTDISILGMDVGASMAIIAVFLAIAVAFAALVYLEKYIMAIPSVIMGIITLAFAICLMADVIENDAGYMGWYLAVLGVGFIIGGFLSKKLAANTN